MHTSNSQATILRALSVGWEVKAMESVIFNTKKRKKNQMWWKQWYTSICIRNGFCFLFFFSLTWWHFRNMGICSQKVSELKCWIEGIIFIWPETIVIFPALFTTGKPMFYCFELFISEVCWNYYDLCERKVVVVSRDVLNGISCPEFLPERVNRAFNYCHLQ